MKALSLTQPWATLVAIGAKQIEARSWGTQYRGPVAIHAAKRFPAACRQTAHNCGHFPDVLFRAVLPDGWDEHLPLGAVIATAYLADCFQFGEYPPLSAARYSTAPYELTFGDFTQGRYGFVLRDVLILPKPIPARGALNLWEWQEPW